jgi:hypothetical protein
VDRQIPAYGGFSVRYRITATLKVQGRSVSVCTDHVWLQNGRIVVVAAFANTDQPYDPDLERALLAKLGARLQAAA